MHTLPSNLRKLNFLIPTGRGSLWQNAALCIKHGPSVRGRFNWWFAATGRNLRQPPYWLPLQTIAEDMHMPKFGNYLALNR